MGQVSDTKEKLLAGAIELMYARSYTSVGVQELCDHAGVKKGSFYHFFPSKCELTLAALDRQAQVTRRTMLEPAFSKDRPPLKRLEKWFDIIYEQTAAMKKQNGHVCGCAIGNLAIEMSTLEEPIRRKVDQMLRGLTTYVEEALRDAIEAREVPKQDTRISAEALVAYMEGVMLLAKTRNDPEVIRHLGRNYLRSLAGGASARAKTRRGAV